MAAVRCAARKLGGCLLQRTRHRLVPSRFLRSRQLPGEVSSEDKKVELRNLVSKAMQKRVELQDALSEVEKYSEVIGEPEMRLLLQRISLPKAVPKPHATPWTWGQFATRTKCYMEAAANLTVFLAVTAYVVCVKGDRGVQEQALGVNEENQ
ncbi:hypothetical protein VPH35_017549 [Triticum aestivum]